MKKHRLKILEAPRSIIGTCECRGFRSGSFVNTQEDRKKAKRFIKSQFRLHIQYMRDTNDATTPIKPTSYRA